MKKTTNSKNATDLIIVAITFAIVSASMYVCRNWKHKDTDPYQRVIERDCTPKQECFGYVTLPQR